VLIPYLVYTVKIVDERVVLTVKRDEWIFVEEDPGPQVYQLDAQGTDQTTTKS